MDANPRPHIAAIDRPRQLLAEEDATQLKILDPRDIQRWCDARIAQYASHIYALRSARNDGAPIHRLLPPELLLEIFANLLPTPMRRRHGLPVLRVCRRWRMLVLDTPQFWVNLIGQTLEATRVPRVERVELARLKFALARSATLKLTLSWRGCSAAVVDMFLPYAHRISSLTAIFTSQEGSHMSRFVEAELPALEHLSLTYNRYRQEGALSHSVSPIAVRVSRFPRLQALQLVRSPLVIPAAPSSLRELDLHQVGFRDPNDPGTACRGVGPIIDVLSSHNRLETLCIRDSLPGNLWETSPSASPVRTVHLPLLRTLVVRDDPRSIRVFLVYLDFPSTTKLEIEIETQRQDGTIVMPFPPHLATLPADDARVSLVLKLDSSAMSHWEVYVDGSQTLRLTVFRDRDPERDQWESHPSASARVMAYTREVFALFAPPRLLTALAISGAELLGPQDRVTLLVDLSRLTRLRITGPDGRLDGEVLAMLAARGSELLCPALEHLSFSWLHTSDRLAWTQCHLRGWGQQVPPPQPHCMGSADPDVRLDGQRRAVTLTGDPKTWRPYGAEASHAFCEAVASFLARRAAVAEAHAGGRPLKSLSLAVAIRRPRVDYVRHGWDVPAVRARLEEGLGLRGSLVGSVSVEYTEA
ncbi:hypothetical protein GSI_10139 [Ganoderma sinense ZZ0214-1]|uniref:F-box domain-containing protein n=1 Tax=Ganoderma sinense ZZ0214-1 TaxID=1077348 RepID=A0A2G8RZQ3_9APHY|nr:hypothetical protein GSI_10139 [Ganoderma sinense ZZ0214-1]